MHVSDRIEGRMKLHDLHVLMTVVQAGSMVKAAVRLNSCQPAISRSIAQLEHTLGVRLLDRSRQGVKPTEYGRALLDGGTAAFDDLRRAVKNIEFLADPSVGEVRVGCNPFLAASFVAAAVDRLSRRYPRIVFRVVTGYADMLGRELIERRVDLLIARRYSSIADERLDYKFLFDDPYSVAVGTQNPLARRRSIELGELVNEAWVLPPQESALGAVVMKYFRANGLDYPHTAVIGEPAEMRISLLATGRYITIFANSVFKFSAGRSELKVLPVKQSLSTVPVGIVTLKNRTLTPAVQLFIDSACEVGKQLAKTK